MKIGRNELCPCGSGKKYKKCCIDNKQLEEELMKKLKYLNPFEYHDNYIHTKKVNAPQINKILLNVYDNQKSMDTIDVVTDYLQVMDYLLEYAKKHKLKTIEDLDKCELVGDFVGNVIGDFQEVVYNLKKEDYDFSVIINYLDKLVSTLKLDEHAYLSSISQKAELLFKLGKFEDGEKIMLDYLEINPKATYAYVALVDDFLMTGNLEKAKHYYELGVSQGKMEDIEALEERINYFK